MIATKTLKLMYVKTHPQSLGCQTMPPKSLHSGGALTNLLTPQHCESPALSLRSHQERQTLLQHLVMKLLFELNHNWKLLVANETRSCGRGCKNILKDVTGITETHRRVHTTLILKYLVKSSLLVLGSKKFICKNFFFFKPVTTTSILILPSEIQNQSNPWQFGQNMTGINPGTLDYAVAL